MKEEDMHTSTGLNKLELTFTEVAVMKEQLSVKQKDLESKNIIANQKLSLMTSEQQKAQITKDKAVGIFNQVKIQSETIETKSKDIKKELSQVEPALEEAREALSVIDRTMLNEIRCLHTPPALIKLAIGAVYELVNGGNPDDWKAVRSFLNRDDFVSTIKNFKSESITSERRKAMTKYLENEKFTPEQIARGSSTCVPLVKWVKAHINYCDMLMKIDPLRNELADLETKKAEAEIQAKELEHQITELEEKITQYKNEYSILIREIEEIKIGLSQTEKKVNTSENLLSNLEVEQKRWANTHDAFQEKLNVLLGNCILLSAFMIYFGNFDKKMRDILWNTWVKILKDVKIPIDSSLLRVEYLSSPDERMRWLNYGLPNESLSFENATIIQHSSCYPFIIDPSGQALAYITRLYNSSNIVTSSFLNTNFKKDLDSALRFGNTILVTNAEFYDPIISSLVDSEVKKREGRNIVLMAGQEIDISPAFQLFLITNDPSYRIPFFLSSRMCITNFTVTFSGLESQCLYQIFKNECPELEQKRTELTKLQGEYALKLFHLQKKLLQVLNEAQGGLLDDERIIYTLQQLNKQATEINSKVKDSDSHMLIINEALQFYMPLATICSSIYFMLQDLYHINIIYQYNLNFFFDIFNSLFKEQLKRNDDRNVHLKNLITSLFSIVVKRVIYGLLQSDKQLFLLLLAKIYLSILPKSDIFISSINFIYNSKAITISQENFISFSKFSSDAQIAVNKLLTLRQFKNCSDNILKISDNILEWTSQLQSVITTAPCCWNKEQDVDNALYCAFNSLLLGISITPDNYSALVDNFINSLFGNDLFKLYSGQLNLLKIVFYEVKCTTPIILLSVSGYDPSSWIEDLIQEAQVTNSCTLAMGSSEGDRLAEKALLDCARDGKWLILKNIHLASHWIKDLEKKMNELNFNPKFRLFLTAEMFSSIPSSLVRVSRFLTFEPPPGVKQCLYRAFDLLPESKFSMKPSARPKIYFLVAWLHAIIVERMNYSNIGWSKTYDFSEADLRVAFNIVDSWLKEFSTDVSIDKLPLGVIKSLLSASIYGSYVENPFDQNILSSLVQDIFANDSFAEKKVLVPNISCQKEEIIIQNLIKYKDYIKWIDELPNQQNTIWLRLPNSAEYLLKINKFESLRNKLAEISELSDKAISKSESSLGSISHKTNIAFLFSEHWIKTLTQTLKCPCFSISLLTNPIARFYVREFSFGQEMLTQIHQDLLLISSYKQEKIKLDNNIDYLINMISIAQLPNHWNKYTVPSSIALNSWMLDFSLRIEHLQTIGSLLDKDNFSSVMNASVLIGKFFFPEAYATSIRQYTAQQLKLPMEELSLNINPQDSLISMPNGKIMFSLVGLKILGGKYDKGYIELSEDLSSSLPNMMLEWLPKENFDNNSDTKKGYIEILLPVYLDISRRNIMFTINLPVKDMKNKDAFYHHGVAIIANTFS